MAMQDAHTWKLINENRLPNRIPHLGNMDDFINHQYQPLLEEALLDQIPLNQLTKQMFFKSSNQFLFSIQKKLFNFSDFYVHFRKNQYLYGNRNDLYLLSNRGFFPKESYEKTLGLINYAIHDNPDADFYVYYVIRETDIRFDNMSKCPYWRCLYDNLNLPSSHKDSLHVSTFNDYKRYFRRTDHHWNQIGAYEAYTQIFKMLRLDADGEKLITPVEQNDSLSRNLISTCPYAPDGKSILISSNYHQTKSIRTGYPQLFEEEFYAYRFDYPQMATYINGEKSIYGLAEEFYNGKKTASQLTYSAFYGNDYGETIFQTKRIERPNILVIGDSFDNPIIQLIASHFHNTYSIDIRHYLEDKGEEFMINDYIRKNHIDNVLFVVGSINSFLKQSEHNDFS
ncbi:MAG: hypothetical protein IKH26_02705 [Bacteroidaceae bacterium]|nr:hypothetical protein [Bacteroidaceae bacterium]